MSGGTLQSLIAVAGGENSELISDSAALIPDTATAAEVRHVSPITLAPRRGRAGEVIAPMAPAPFINPAVIHRTAAVSDVEAGRAPAPFRYREGIVIGSGGAATLPLRWGVAGALSATQIGLRSFAGARPAVRRRLAGALGRIGPGSGYGPAASRLEGWRWRTRCGMDAGRARHPARRGRRHACPLRLSDPGARARQRVHRALRPRAAPLHPAPAGLVRRVRSASALKFSNCLRIITRSPGGKSTRIGRPRSPLAE